MKTTPPLEIAHQDSSNITAKDYTMTWKEVACVVKVMTRKTSQTKYHEVSASCLYLNNQNLI
jgi:hypothetical protein